MPIMKAGVWQLPTSLYIRQYLHSAGPAGGNPYAMWKSLREQRKLLGIKCGTYTTFATYIHSLRKLGFIEVIRTEPGSHPFIKIKKFYGLVDAHKNAKEWRNPRAYLYPDSWKHGHSKP